MQPVRRGPPSCDQGQLSCPPRPTSGQPVGSPGPWGEEETEHFGARTKGLLNDNFPHDTIQGLGSVGLGTLTGGGWERVGTAQAR